MSAIDAARVLKPKYFSISPLRRGRYEREPYVIGFDSEAEGGKPFLYQFALPNGRVDLVDVSRKPWESLNVFLKWVHGHCSDRHREYLIFGFNLQYEYTQLFRHLPIGMTTLPEFKFETGDHVYIVSVLNEKRFKFTLEDTRSKLRITVLDAMAFLPMSLDAASKLVDIGKKLPKPDRFTRKERHTPEFEAYARQDAILTQKLGEIIVGWHKEADVTQTMSAPMLAARTFRRSYLSATLEPLPVDAEQYGLNSYHGGKNGYYATKPMLVRKAYNYDIVSAYPEAMRQLPCLDHLQMRFLDHYERDAHATYHARIRYEGCRYEAAYNIDGTRTMAGSNRELYVTGYELAALLDNRECRILSADGWELYSVCDCNRTGSSPLARFVDTYFALKRTATNPAARAWAKLNLNSLYGKFFQKQPQGTVGVFDIGTGEYVEHDPDEPYDFIAGGLYHPPIASLITGYVRAKIHRLEHKYQSLMTSTDGFFSTIAPDPVDLGDGLGALTCTEGELRIWKERVYVFDGKDGKRKYALHGFRGTVADLLRAPLSLRAFTYRATEMVTLRKSRNLIAGQKHEPGEFVEHEFTMQPMATGP